MSEAWIEIVVADGSRRRHTLQSGLTSIGGRQGDIELPGSDSDQLHLWDQPPKLIFVGVGPPPTVNGERREESTLAPGDVIQWRGARIEFGGLPHAAIVEVAHEALPAPVGLPAAGAPVEDLAWRRLRAGLLVELGIAEPASARRWQEAVMRSEFDPDACARDVLAASNVGASDSRVLERSARLLRDLIMAPVQLSARPTTKKARSVARSGLAMAIVQFVVFGICCLFVFVAMFIVRWRWDWSVDAFLDSIGNALTGS